MKIFRFLFLLIILFNGNKLFADEPSRWLKNEIDKILISYQSIDLPNENRFLMIEQTINNNFAGTGIAKFVVGEAWNKASNDIKQARIKASTNLIKKLTPILESYSKDNSIRIIVQKKHIVMGSKEDDITSDILNLVNQKIKSVKID